MQFLNVLNGQRGVYYTSRTSVHTITHYKGYHTMQNFGGRKSWRIWQIARDLLRKFSCPKFSFLNQKYVAIQCMASSPLYVPLQAILVTHQKPSDSTFYFPIGSKINTEVFTARKFA